MTSSTLDLEEAGYDNTTGFGLVQATDALVYTYTEPCETDADGDGYIAAEACGGSDCNDNDASIKPGIPENCDDTIDQDCDGVDLSCTPEDVCLASGEDCSSHAECCSGRCRPRKGCR